METGLSFQKKRLLKMKRQEKIFRKPYFRLRTFPGKLQRKAAIELQFHWVFVLIAGAIILLFFGSVVFKQKEISEDWASTNIVFDLDGIIAGASASQKTLNSIDLTSEIKFKCNEYSVGKKPRPVGKTIVFAPDLLKGRKLIPWALPWQVPYKVTNFLFLSTDNVKYVVVDNPDINVNYDIEVYDELNLTKELVNPVSGVTNTNNYKIRFIFFNQEIPNPINLPDLGIADKDITAVNIIPDSDAAKWDDFGTIRFYKKQGTGFSETRETYYLRRASVYGAIFSEDVDSYDCSMKKAFQRLNLVNQVYKEKVSKLNRITYPSGYFCINWYAPALSNLEDINTKSLSLSNSFDSLDNIKDLSLGTEELSDRNQGLLLHSCPLIY